MNNPMISVVMPVYNGEKYLREAIESILKQTYTDFEFIILNDGSTDKTEEIILSYTDPRIVYVKNEENLQIVKTLNKGIALAKGKYIARMDADDISLPERFEKQVTFLEENPEIDICGTWMKTIGVQKNTLIDYPVTHNEIKSFMFFNSPMSHPTVLAKRIFYKDLKYDEQFNKVEDYHLWYTAIDMFRFANLPEVLFLYRVHKNMTTNVYNDMQVKRADEIRTMMLNKLDLKYSQDEKRLHMNFLHHKYIETDLMKQKEWLHKFMDQNAKSNYADQQALAIYIGEYWWQLFSLHTDRGFWHFISFMRSDLRKYSSISILKYIKFFIKCLIGYKYKGGLYEN